MRQCLSLPACVTPPESREVVAVLRCWQSPRSWSSSWCDPLRFSMLNWISGWYLENERSSLSRPNSGTWGILGWKPHDPKANSSLRVRSDQKSIFHAKSEKNEDDHPRRATTWGKSSLRSQKDWNFSSEPDHNALSTISSRNPLKSPHRSLEIDQK